MGATGTTLPASAGAPEHRASVITRFFSRENRYLPPLFITLILVVGQNPGTNHPRMLSALTEAKAHGAHIVAVNPLPEAGLFNFIIVYHFGRLWRNRN